MPLQMANLPFGGFVHVKRIKVFAGFIGGKRCPVKVTSHTLSDLIRLGVLVALEVVRLE